MTSQNAYLRTRVMTASPAELRLMLFDGAIRFLTQGVEGLEAGQHEQAYDGYSQCQAIIVELINALDPKHSPELCRTLSSLYTFMYTQLVESLTNREPATGREVLGLLEYERETWRLVMDALANEGAESADVVMATRTAAAAGAGSRTLPGQTPGQTPSQTSGSETGADSIGSGLETTDHAAAEGHADPAADPTIPGRTPGGIPSPYGNIEPRHAGPIKSVDPRRVGGRPGHGSGRPTDDHGRPGGGTLSVKG